MNAIIWISVCFVLFVNNCPPAGRMNGWLTLFLWPSDEDLQLFLGKQWENRLRYLRITDKTSLGAGSVITLSSSGVWGGEAGGNRCDRWDMKHWEKKPEWQPAKALWRVSTGNNVDRGHARACESALPCCSFACHVITILDPSMWTSCKILTPLYLTDAD